jgi:hypothetical protein
LPPTASFDVPDRLFPVSSLGTVIVNLPTGRVNRRWNYALVLAII